MIFLVVLSRKMIFLFPENVILFFRRKIKDDLSQKIHGNMIFSSNAWKDGLSKKNCTGIWSFLYYVERWYFFSGKYYLFSLDGKWKMIFSQEIHGNMIFPVYMYKCYKYITLLQENQRWSSPEKIQLKVIDIWDRILEIVKTILCTFTETFIDVFIYYFPVKKKTGNLIYRIEIWLLLQFIWLDSLMYNEESSMLCTIQLSGLVFRRVLERQLRKKLI